jgi:hypothetical protein
MIYEDPFARGRAGQRAVGPTEGCNRAVASRCPRRARRLFCVHSLRLARFPFCLEAPQQEGTLPSVEPSPLALEAVEQTLKHPVMARNIRLAGPGWIVTEIASPSADATERRPTYGWASARCRSERAEPERRSQGPGRAVLQPVRAPHRAPRAILNRFICIPGQTKAPRLRGFREIAGAGFEPATFGL